MRNGVLHPQSPSYTIRSRLVLSQLTYKSTYCNPQATNVLLPQNVMAHLGEQWQSLTLAEQSVLVDIFHSPQSLFTFDSKPYHKAMNTFCKR